MALYRLEAKVLSRSPTPVYQRDSQGNAVKDKATGKAVVTGYSPGSSAIAAAAYRAGEKLRDPFDHASEHFAATMARFNAVERSAIPLAERSGRTHDYSRRKGVVFKELMLPANAPATLQDRQTFWTAIEASHRRKDAQVAWEFLLTLPRELSLEQNIALTQRFVREMFLSRGIACDVSLHAHAAADGLPHIHAHILMSRRPIVDGGFGNIDREQEDNPRLINKIWALEKEGDIVEALALLKGTNLQRWRKHWEVIQNEALADAESAARVDHRTLEAQGIDREPEPVMGKLEHMRQRLGDRLDFVTNGFKRLLAVRFRNSVRQQARAVQIAQPSWMAEFLVKAREFGDRLFPELSEANDQGRGYGRQR